MQAASESLAGAGYGPETAFGIVVMAASAGGLAALTEVLSAMPRAFPIPIAVVLHRSAQLPNMLAVVLARRTALRVKLAEAGETMSAGTVYVAPPTLQMTLTATHAIALTAGILVNHLYCSADPLFHSVAVAYGSRGVAVVLTGLLSDGASGALAIKRAGGTVIAQDRATSEQFGMPHAAIVAGAVDLVLPITHIGPALIQLAAPGGTYRG